MRRREFITLVGSAVAAWPVVARAQQTAKPVIGLAHLSSAASTAHQIAALRQGLGVGGFIDGQNVSLELHWMEGRYDQLPGVMADFVRRHMVVIIACGGISPTEAAKAATQTIPIVFVSGDDPVRSGLVASLSRPGGNVTGIVFFNGALAAKRLELVRELVPTATSVAYVANPLGGDSDRQAKEVRDAAGALGMQLHILNASTASDIDRIFQHVAALRVQALVMASDPVLGGLREQWALRAAQLKLPLIGTTRDYVEVGGLMTYGSSITDAYHLAGIYTGRILKGEKPADLPVMQPTRLELAINLKTARALGLTVPPTLLARADEVIE